MTERNDVTATPSQAVGADQPELSIDKSRPDKDPPTGQSSTGKQLALGLLFGLAFGFLLQKGGVAKYHVLIGVLLLEDFTVIKVMLSAIVVGMIGVFGLYALGLVKLHVKPTRYAANILGGLMFGVGFALLSYCPGTGAAALGQGNFDALAGILGLMAGSYLYAESSGLLGRTVLKWGDRGKLTLPELVRISPATFVLIFASLLVVALVVLERVTIR
ncbi:MAG TPA: YeeE/YedE thiosulfate transporter family protein [Pirellulaceae bacterium]|nr:YeeE/YedE thiosulfate transporter family protein [Pirellulaceae bacterium]